MINAYVGKNAAGKTSNLRKRYEEAKAQGSRVITNLIDIRLYRMVNVDITSLEIVNDLMELDTLKVLNREIVFEEQLENHTQAFLNLVNVMCKDVDVICIDEPEVGLSEQEAQVCGLILNQISRKKLVWITTHNDNFTWFDDCKLYCVEEEN